VALAGLALAPAGCATLFGKHGAEPPPADATAAAGDSAGAQTTATSAAEPSGKSAKATAAEAEKAAHPEPPSGPVTITDVAKLKAMGPVYTPYDLGPILVPGDWLGDLLQDTLVPVIEKHHLPPTTGAYYWVLLDTQGEVKDVVLHTTSENARFDQAARAAALHLHYLAAHRDGKRVPVWVLVRVSLLMR
jgi:hypothetical protein